MKRRHIGFGSSTLFFLAIFFLLSSLSAWADVSLKQEHKTDGYQFMGRSVPARDTTQITWIGADKIRTDSDKQSIIVRLDQMVMYMIDHATRSYSIVQLDEGHSRNDSADREPSRDKRRPSGRMAPREMVVGVTVTDTGEQKKIGSWKCRKYVQKMDTVMGPSTSEIWATSDIKTDPAILARFNAAMALPMGIGSMSGITEELSKIKGVPVLTNSTVEMRGARVKSSTRLLEFKEEQAPQGTFDLPAGYKKRAM